jgi:hypothetical protein
MSANRKTQYYNLVSGLRQLHPAFKWLFYYVLKWLFQERILYKEQNKEQQTYIVKSLIEKKSYFISIFLI